MSDNGRNKKEVDYDKITRDVLFGSTITMGDINLSDEIRRLIKLRRLLSKAWIPMGIEKEEAIDILQWAIDDEPYKIHIADWAERISERTGVKVDPKKDTILKTLIKVALEWQRRKKIIIG